MILLFAPLLSIAMATPQNLFPAISASLQDDASTIWNNPANFSFSPKASKAYVAQFTDNGNSFGYASQLGIVGTGVRYNNDFQYGSWWSFATSLSLLLDDRLSFGATSSWHTLDRYNNNFVSWDLGLGYRPLQWLGFGASWNNLGAPSNFGEMPEQLDMGAGVSVFHNRLQMAVDYLSNKENLTSKMGDFRYTVRTFPTQGFSIQLQGTNTNEIGIGLNLGHGYGTIGAFSNFGDEQRNSLVATTGIDDTSIFARGRRVAYFSFDSSIPYQTTAGLFSAPTESYFSFYNRLHKAALDPALKGIVLHIDRLSFSLAQIEELRKEIIEAKNRGKKILVYLEGSAGNAEYYFATAASKIYLHPAGSLELIGLHSERMYLKGFLDQVGVKAEFVKRSDYKSAPEQYTHLRGSDASKEQSKELLDSIFSHFTQEIGSARSLPHNSIVALIDQAPFTAKQAQEKELVDQLLFADEFKDLLDTEFGEFHRLEKEYGQKTPSGWENNFEIALIPITGMITSGKSQSPGLLGGSFTAGADTIIAQLKKATKDSAVKAIVIRVDSPGGSAFASDQIWRAVELAKKKKPVIVSMGGVAASGGYYVSAGANKIFAENTTITGSIGVYSGKFNMSGLASMLHINIETENRGKNAGLYSSFEEWDQEQRELLERHTEETYLRFKSVVSAGRSLSLEDVEAVAQGHVWSGTKAKEIGLVDDIGGLFDAIDYAKEIADVSFGGSTLVQYQELSGGSSLYKFEVKMQELTTHPIENDIALLKELSQENCWLLEPIYQIR